MDKLAAFGGEKPKKGSAGRASSTIEKNIKKTMNSAQIPGGRDVYEDLRAITKAVDPELVERYRKGDPSLVRAASEAGIPATLEEAEEKWKTLDISNDYIFGFVMRNKDLCEELLRRILPDIPGLEIVEVRQQSVVENALGVHGIRLDVYARDVKNVFYDIEMQVSSKTNLPKRMRFYQGTLDSRNLEKGCEYEFLPETYVIFICCFDPFGKGQLLYSFQNYCKDADLYLGDGSTKIVVNVTGKDDKLKDLQVFADYVAGEAHNEDDFVTRLQQEVVRVKNDSIFRGGYLMYNAALMGDISNALKEREQLGMQKGREEERLVSVAYLIARADEKTAKELLDATDEEIKAAKELLVGREVVLR